jgi:hypothetical protein
MTEPSVTGALTLGHILAIAGLDVDNVMVIRHTLTPNGLRLGSSPDEVAAYTREQPFGNKIGINPPRYWICFMAEGGRRCRLHTIYENYGEVVAERTEDKRFFDLIPSVMLKSLVDRLVIEWGKDTINWAKMGADAATFPVLKIADPAPVPFPGFDDLELDHVGLLALFEDSRYESWHSALGAVQGIYVIADQSNGKLYVGKADGSERILGRWRQYAQNGHGDNIELKRLLSDDPQHARHFQYSLLRVFGPSVDESIVNRAEGHFKRTLQSRKPHGYNEN